MLDVERFVADVAAAQIGATRNPYRGRGGPARRSRLHAYLRSRMDAPLLLVGEALGHRGGARTGVPFTCEADLFGAGVAEATARVVQRSLARCGLAEQVLLWNVVPSHPHRRGEPASNRRPTAAEVRAGLHFVERLASGCRVVAIGRLAAVALAAPYLRHPSHGGARAFDDGLARLAAELHR